MLTPTGDTPPPAADGNAEATEPEDPVSRSQMPRTHRTVARLVAGLLTGAAGLAPVTAGTAQAAVTPRVLPARLYGVTVDDIEALTPVLASLRALPQMPTTRVVFDEGMSPGYYAKALDQLRPHSFLLGQPFDSTQLEAAGTSAYRSRFATYLKALGGKVDIWEVGNEINGNWTGPYPTVGAKITDATNQVKAAGGRTALTVWYNHGCGNGPDELDPLPWSKKYLTAATRAKLDYVLVSYYEDDCGFRRPSAATWTAYFKQLRALYPNARVGFGEVGHAEPVRNTAERTRMAALIKYYYTLPVDLPYYALGGFYWNYVQDMIPHQGNALWATLRTTWTAGPNRPPTGASARPAAPRSVVLEENWPGPVGDAWPASSVRGAWASQSNGSGRTAVAQVEGGVLDLAPRRPRSAADSHGSLVTSNARFADFEAELRMKTVSQTRPGAYPGATANPWERASVVWHRVDCQHYYSLVLKTDGWELGKADPGYPGARRSLRTGTDRTFPVGAWNTVRIQQRGGTVTVDVDGTRLTAFTDTERPYRSGSLGLASEDAVVRFGGLTVS
jgi:hypothetical protein